MIYQILFMRKKNKSLFQRKHMEQTTEKPVFSKVPQLPKQWFNTRRYNCIYEDRLFYPLKYNLLLYEPCAELHVVDIFVHSICSQKQRHKIFPAAFKVSSVGTFLQRELDLHAAVNPWPSIHICQGKWHLVPIRVMCVVTQTQIHWDLDCNQQQIMSKALNRSDQILMKF